MNMRHFLLDISPLRDSRPFRLVYGARLATALSTGILLVAVNVQVFALTASSLSVALVSLSLAAPMAVFLLVGGVLADRLDRRRLMLVSRGLYAGCVLVLLANALEPSPALWPVFVATFISGAAAGISIPALMAVTPALVGRDRLAAAGALTALAMHAGGVLGPALAGFLIASFGTASAYAVVLIGALITPALLAFLPPLAPASSPPKSAVSGLVDAIGFVRRSPLIRGLLAVDLIATFFATPFALLPE